MNRKIISKIVKASGVSAGEMVLIHFWGEDADKEIANGFLAAVAEMGATPVLLQQSRSVNRDMFLAAKESCFGEQYFDLFTRFDAVLDVFAYRPVILGYEINQDKFELYRRYMAQLFSKLMNCKRFTQIRIPTAANAEESGLDPQDYIQRMERAYFLCDGRGSGDVFTMPTKLHASKNITLLLLGRTVSNFGSALYLIALPLYILQVTGSLAQTGVFFTLSSLPALVVTPFLGVFVEKVNRKSLLIICDFLTSALYALLLLPLEANGFMPVLFIVTVLVNVISNAFEIGSKLMFSELTTPETIEKYNGIKSFADNTAAVIGPALGTITFGLLGFRFVVLVVAAGYALSAAQECFILYRKTERKLNTEKKNWLVQFWDGLRYVVGQKDVLALFILIMALNFFVANGDEIINPGIIVQKYGISEALFGMTSSAAVLGTLAAGLFIFKNKWIDLQKNLKRLFLINSILMIMIGVGSLCMTAIPRVYFLLFLLFEFLLGVITSCVNVPLTSSLQTRVPIHYQGRFFALLSFFSGLLIPLGITYTGFLASVVGADIAYIINNVCVIMIVLLCWAHIS